MRLLSLSHNSFLIYRCCDNDFRFNFDIRLGLDIALGCNLFGTFLLIVAIFVADRRALLE